MMQRQRVSHIAIWIAQLLVGLSFIVGGIIKLALPIAELAAMWPWAGDLPAPWARLLGVVDLAGGAGVLLPSLTRIRPGVTVAAAVGCVLLQLCAMAFHAARGELAQVPLNLLYLLLSAAIVWGRWKIAPIGARRGT